MGEDRGMVDSEGLKVEEATAAVRNMRRRTKKITPQKAADLNPPPQDNIHGWQEQPKHLLGFWTIGHAEPLPPPEEGWAEEAIAAAAPSVEAAAALAVAAAGTLPDSSENPAEAHPQLVSADGERSVLRRPDGNTIDGDSIDTVVSDQESLEAGGYSDRETAMLEAVDLGSDILHHVTYVVFKRDGSLKAGPARLGISPRSWRFTPANKRIVFEVDVPGRDITLR